MFISLTKKNSFIPTSIILFFIFLSGISLYSTSLTNEFVWDDIILIQKNNSIRTTQQIVDFFYRPMNENFSGYYRPFQMISFKMDFLIWGIEPFGYHLTSVVIHILNSVLVYCLIQTLLQNKLTASLGGFLFLIHPALSECVNYVSSRSNLIIFFFLLLSLIFFIRYDRYKRKVFLVISMSSFICSLFSNEIAFMFPFFLIFYESINKTKFKKAELYIFILLGFIFFRSHIIPLDIYINKLSHASTLLTTPKILFNYLKILLLPIGLHKLWQINPIEKIVSVEFIIYSLLSTSIIVICKKLQKNNRSLFLGIIWFIMMILPISQVKSDYEKLPFLSEGWLYVPAIGFIILISNFLSKIISSQNKKTKIIALVLTCWIFIACVLLTMKQNKIWSTQTTLFNNISKYNPHQPEILFATGTAYYQKNNYHMALFKYNQALSEYKKFDVKNTKDALFKIHRVKGKIYLILNQYKNASASLKEALKIFPLNSRERYYLSFTYLMQLDIASAIAECKKAIEIEKRPQYLNLLNLLYAVENHLKRNEQFTVNVNINIMSE